MRSEKDLAGLVTFHAVTRYVQRILGVVVDLGGSNLQANSLLKSEQVADLHCQAAGLTIGQVRELIMTPAVALAAAMKLSMASTREFQALLAPSGAVLTILEPRRRSEKPVRIMGRAEGRAHAHKHNRRARRRSFQ